MPEPSAPPAQEKGFPAGAGSSDSPAGPADHNNNPAPASPNTSPTGRLGHSLASLARKLGGGLRRRWRAALAVTVAVLALALVAAYFVINHVIRSQLASLVSENLDGELEGGSISYRPPLGVVVRDARVVRGDGRGGKVELFHVALLQCRFAKAPLGKGPIVIESLVVKGPAVRLVTEEREEGPRMPEPCRDQGAESKLSDKVQVRHLRVEGAALTWRDRNHPDVPDLVVSNVTAGVEPAAAAGGPQAFHVSVKDGPTDLQAAGTFQPDGLLLGLEDVALDVRLDPAARQNALPASVAELASRYGVAGALSLHGKGQVPLRCPRLSTFDGALEVKDARATPPGADTPVDKIRLKVLADTRMPPPDPPDPAASASPAIPTTRGASATRPLAAAPPAVAPPATAPAPPAEPGLHLRLAFCEAALGESSLKIDGGEFWEDRARDTWRLADFAGHFTGSVANGKPGPKPEGDPDTRPAQRPKPSTEPVEPGAPPGAPVLRGRLDFTLAAGGPLRGAATRPSAEPEEPLHYELVAIPRDLSFQPSSFPLPIEHIDSGIIRVGAGAATISGLAGTYGGDKMALDSARVPLPRDLNDFSQLWKLETRIEEMSGRLTCYQPGPVYPRGVQGVFHSIHPEGDFLVNGRLTLNHRLPQRDKPKPRDDFALEVTSDGGGSFTLTDLGIPVTHVRGKAKVDSLGTVIGTDGQRDSVVEGHSMGGTVSLHMNVTPASDRGPAVFRGEAWLRDVNMILLCKLLNVKEERLSKAGGKGYLHSNFTIQGAGGPRPPADTLRAAGEMEVIGANFWEDPVVGVIAENLQGGKPGAPSAAERGVGDAAALFHVADRVVTLEQAAVNSPTVGIQGSGTIGFDLQLNLQIVATPIGNLKAAIKQSAPPGVGEVAGDLVGVVQGIFRTAAGTLLYQYRVTGPAAHPRHEVVPAPVLGEAGAALFGRMADPRDGDLLESVRSATRPSRGANAPKK